MFRWRYWRRVIWFHSAFRRLVISTTVKDLSAHFHLEVLAETHREAVDRDNNGRKLSTASEVRSSGRGAAAPTEEASTEAGFKTLALASARPPTSCDGTVWEADGHDGVPGALDPDADRKRASTSTDADVVAASPPAPPAPPSRPRGTSDPEYRMCLEAPLSDGDGGGARVARGRLSEVSVSDVLLAWEPNLEPPLLLSPFPLPLTFSSLAPWRCSV